MSGHQYDARPIGLDALHDEETISTAASGGKKGVKITMVGALDPVAIMEVARVAGYGAGKYEAFNYLQGFEYSKAYNAMQRHLNLFWAGEDIDPESGRLHLGHAAIEAMFLISFFLRGIGTDDRPPRLDGGDVPRTLDQLEQWMVERGGYTIGAPRLDLGFTVDPTAPVGAPDHCQHLDNRGQPCLEPRAWIGHEACKGAGCLADGIIEGHHAYVAPRGGQANWRPA